MAAQQRGGRQKDKKAKISWWLPLDVLAPIREEATRLDINEGRLVAAIIRERLPTLQSRPIQRYAVEATRQKPVKQAKNRMEQTLAEFQ